MVAIKFIIETEIKPLSFILNPQVAKIEFARNGQYPTLLVEAIDADGVYAIDTNGQYGFSLPD